MNVFNRRKKYLFRGKVSDDYKSVDKGEWVYGWLAGDDDAYIISSFAANRGVLESGEKTICPEISDIYRVDPETVGQYIGAKDHLGVKIFEGDIVVTNWQNRTGVIKFLLGEYVLAQGCLVTSMNTLIAHKWQLSVVANETDNPELL